MKLLLVLFALLTGFGGTDAPASRATVPASLGAVVQVAQGIVQHAAAATGLRFQAKQPSLADVADMSDCPDLSGNVTLASLTLPTRADRARE